jgi:hypothetical protein
MSPTVSSQRSGGSKKSTGVLVCNPNMSRGSARKPYCAVCFKAGKSVDVYTNHFTKSSLDSNATVVCPTILAAQCAYCKKTGHFKSVCPMLKEKEKNAQRKVAVTVALVSSVSSEKGVSQSKQRHQSGFSVFGDDEEDSCDECTEENVTVSTADSDEMGLMPVTYASVCKMTSPVRTKQTLSAFPFPRKCISHNWADNDYWTDDE